MAVILRNGTLHRRADFASTPHGEEDPAHPRYIQTVWGLGYVFYRTVLKHEAIALLATKFICPTLLLIVTLLFVSLVTTYLVG